MKKIVRTATVPMSLDTFCEGLLSELKSDGYEVVAVSSPDKELQVVGEREGVRTIAVPMERHISPLKDFVSLCKMTKVMIQEKPDMVHSMTPKAGLITMIAAWIARVPVRVHTFTGLVWPTATGMSRKILMMTDKITCACATYVIPEGEGVKADLAAHITKKPMKVLGYGNVRGIDLSHYVRNNENYNENENPHADGVLTFLFVGRLVKDKGINELVRAFVRLFNENYNENENKKCGGVRLVLVGREEPELDPLLPETKRMIEECLAIDAVGEQKDVRPWMEMSDVLAFPSYREGFPNVVIEAGAMDLPSIVTDINGSREIICGNVETQKHRNSETQKLGISESSESSEIHTLGDSKFLMKFCDNGVIIPSQNEDALYEAMKWMVEHPEERERMARNARPMVANRFEQSYVRQCLKDFYKEILEK